MDEHQRTRQLLTAAREQPRPGFAEETWAAMVIELGDVVAAAPPPAIDVHPHRNRRLAIVAAIAAIVTAAVSIVAWP